MADEQVRAAAVAYVRQALKKDARFLDARMVEDEWVVRVVVSEQRTKKGAGGPRSWQVLYEVHLGADFQPLYHVRRGLWDKAVPTEPAAERASDADPAAGSPEPPVRPEEEPELEPAPEQAETRDAQVGDLPLGPVGSGKGDDEAAPASSGGNGGPEATSDAAGAEPGVRADGRETETATTAPAAEEETEAAPAERVEVETAGEPAPTPVPPKVQTPPAERAGPPKVTFRYVLERQATREPEA
ncbi:MAG: hypothetical protein K6U08_08700 [Firmicutes bacterium]|nr:hypothetical protein [Bacillota bacterium]